MSRAYVKMRPMGDRAETTSSLAPGAQVAGYVIDQRIGVGGFGEVFRARQPVIGREVAIKVLFARFSADPESVARFVAEARAVNQISHAGIVEIFDFGRLDDGREYCVMELLEGRTLGDLLRERGRLPLAEALPILRGIAAAADAAHAAGIAHRDLKPDNVFVMPDGRTKLIDFGLAKLMRERESITRTGSIFGTPLYMSPEQCRGSAIDTRTDTYSFGVLAYHVLVGEPPFSGDPIALALHHLNDRPEAPSKRGDSVLPRYVDHVLMSLLAKDPVDRPQSLGTAVSALEGSITLRRMRSRHARQVATTALVVGALTFAGYQLTRHDVVVDPGCAPAFVRLRGVWDPIVRAAVGLRFAARGRDQDIAGGRVSARYFDETAAKWGRQWDAACRSPDRATAALLYAQRLTCLENVLIDLHGQIDAISISTGGNSYGRMVDDCANPAVLAGQVAAPPPIERDHVAKLLLDVYRAYDAAGKAGNERDAETFSRNTAGLDALASQLASIHPPASAIPILLSADLVVSNTWDLAARLPRARAALAAAIPKIEATRDEVMIADIYLLQAQFELDDERDGDQPARAREAIARAEQAIAKAGNPSGPMLDLSRVRGLLARATGEPEAEVAASGDEQRRLRAVFGAYPSASRLYAFALAAAGQDEAALREARGQIAAATVALGADFDPNPHAALQHVCEYVGDVEHALLEARRARAAWAGPDLPAHADAWGQITEIELDAQLGRATDAEITSAVQALAGRGTTPPMQSSDGLATARRAGAFTAWARATELEASTGSAVGLDAAAVLAFAHGDAVAMATAANAVVARCAKTPCRDWIRTSRWLAILAEAKAHAGIAIDAQLATLEAEYDHDHLALANTGMVLASIERWDDALAKLEAARAVPNVWEWQADLLEVDAWLAVARLHHGDVAGARRALEEALDTLARHNDFLGFSYMTPVAELALAQILPDHDRRRARWLAGRARDHFARLGRFREPERQGAIHWLDDHP